MSRLATLLHQVGPFHFMRVVLFEAVRRGLSPHTTLSYAQSGEDLVIDNLLGHRKMGFYVDVGCNHPIKISNTYRFYLRGWRGIAIDANAEFAKYFAELRPRDIFVTSCVSDKIREVDFRIYNSRALSSVGETKFYDNDLHYKLERIERLETASLNEILARYCAPQKFELLSIDVEGHDFEVLRSIDLNRYQPEVLLVEVNGCDLDVGAIEKSNIVKYLAQYAYDPVAVHWSNLFFRKAASLAPAPEAGANII